MQWAPQGWYHGYNGVAQRSTVGALVGEILSNAYVEEFVMCGANLPSQIQSDIQDGTPIVYWGGVWINDGPFPDASTAQAKYPNATYVQGVCAAGALPAPAAPAPAPASTPVATAPAPAPAAPAPIPTLPQLGHGEAVYPVYPTGIGAPTLDTAEAMLNAQAEAVNTMIGAAADVASQQTGDQQQSMQKVTNRAKTVATRSVNQQQQAVMTVAQAGAGATATQLGTQQEATNIVQAAQQGPTGEQYWIVA